MAQTSFYAKNYVCWPPVHITDYANPESAHWQEDAEFAMRKLQKSAWDTESFTTFQSIYDPQASTLTWKEIHEIFDFAWRAVESNPKVDPYWVAIETGLVEAGQLVVVDHPCTHHTTNQEADS